jgi:chloramphenicol O-acetyltransferase type A
MQKIDIQSWSRREHFELFREYGYPHFGMCANIDLTALYPYVKELYHSFTLVIVYLISRVANSIPEFCYRIRQEQVIQHEIVNPSFTLLVTEDNFSFCHTKYFSDFLSFEKKAQESILKTKQSPSVDQILNDDVLYMTAIPWVSFTSFLHPMRLQPEDSIPRFVWGKFYPEGERLKMPLGVQGHHALIDGIHIGKFYAELERSLKEPAVVLGGI